MAQTTAVLIGAGRMGRAHGEALRQLGVALAAVCDRRQEACRDVGEAFAVPADRRFMDTEALFAAVERPDLVVIATTADTHAELVRAAARAGAGAIVCEKPMAVSVGECDTMLEACQASGTRIAINHQMRFMDQYRLVQDVLKSGRLGRLASMNVVAGAFGLAMNGSHYVEAFNFLTGSWPVSVSGQFTGEPMANPRGPAFFDQGGDFVLRAENGQRLTLSIGHDQGHGMTVTYAGEWGHVFVDELQGEAIITCRESDHRDAPPTRYGMPWERETLTFAPADNVGPTRAVLEAAIAGHDYPDGHAGRRVVASVAACYASAEQGGIPVAIPGDEALIARRFPWA